MKTIRFALATACALASGAATAALNAGDQYHLDQLLNGGPASLRSVAQNVFRTGASLELIDVMAEVMLQNQNDASRTGADAVAWGCKAVAAHGGKRYATVLQSLAGNESLAPAIRKHCSKAAEEVGAAEGYQYEPGSVKLDKLRAKSGGGASANAAVSVNAGGNTPAPQGNGQFKPITEVKPGMSMEQAYAIAGPPTSSGSHITGKAFVPFNFKGSDSYRTNALYKGQGRIVFSNNSAYSTGQKVLEVQVNPNETGYP